MSRGKTEKIFTGYIMKFKIENKLDKNIFLELEYGLPLTKNPFAVIGKKLNISKDKVLSKIDYFMSNNLIRRFGGVFELNKLGYCSMLCAVKVKQTEIEKISKHLISIPNITHCYIRDYPVNLWFTFSAEKKYFSEKITELRKYFAPDNLICLKALKRFKLSVIFDLGIKKINQNLDNTITSNDLPVLTSIDKKLVRELWSIPVISNPYEVIANKLDLSLDYVLDKLLTWKQNGILKRIAIVPYHYNLGYKANIMCVWKADAKNLDKIGNEVAEYSEVSHCYERKTCPEFNYNLYAMIHGNCYEDAMNSIKKISDNLSLDKGFPLLSTKEIKKTSLRLFQ